MDYEAGQSVLVHGTYPSDLLVFKIYYKTDLLQAIYIPEILIIIISENGWLGLLLAKEDPLCRTWALPSRVGHLHSLR